MDECAEIRHTAARSLDTEKVLTVSLPVSVSPLSSCSVCPLCPYAVNFDGFPLFNEPLL